MSAAQLAVFGGELMISLKAQTARTTHVPVQTYKPAPPPYMPTAGPSTPTLANHYLSPAVKVEQSPKQTKKTKKQKKWVHLPSPLFRLTVRNDGSSSFPTPYYFESAADTEALARRAARFQAAAPTQNTQNGIGVSGWFGDDGDSNGLGMVPGQVNKGKMRGKGAFGYGAAEVMEVDPVSPLFLFNALLMTECD